MKNPLIIFAVALTLQAGYVFADDASQKAGALLDPSATQEAAQPGHPAKMAREKKAEGKKSAEKKVKKQDTSSHKAKAKKSNKRDKGSTEAHGKSEGRSNQGGETRGLERSGEMSGRDKSEQGKPEED